MRGFSAFSLNSLFFAEAASVLPDHTHFLATQTRVLDSHAEEHVFVLLVVGGKGVLVQQHQFRVIRARFREVGKIFSNRSDQAGLTLHAFVTIHRHVLSHRVTSDLCNRAKDRTLVRHEAKLC
jgi:hypothetical protein